MWICRSARKQRSDVCSLKESSTHHSFQFLEVWGQIISLPQQKGYKNRLQNLPSSQKKKKKTNLRQM